MKLTLARVRDFTCPDERQQAFLRDVTVPGLAVRATAGSKSYVFTCSLRDVDIRVTIGSVDAWHLDSTDGKRPGARQEARRLRRLVDQGIDPRAERRQREQAEAAARAASRLASEFTLRRLCEKYIEHLKRAGKQAAGDVTSIFKLHVYKSAHADRPARDIGARDVTEILRRVTEAGHGRVAAKARAYLRAAYALALRAELDPTAPADMIGFSVLANPAAATPSLAQFNRALDRVLTTDELRAYLRRVRADKSAARGPLLLSLLLGGQRSAQILRANLADTDISGATITLRDPKGRRLQPRAHVLPLVGEALALLARLVEARKKAIGRAPDAASSAPLFVTGSRRTGVGTLTHVVAEISAVMLANDPPQAGAPFQLRDLRRTAETMLAAMGVSKDVRAQIQSHGLGGIQARHYDRHSYMDEKRNALTAWAAKLAQIEAGTPPASNVVELKKAVRSSERATP